MTNLSEEKGKMDWYDQEKVDNMSFDSSEWSETCKILDNPDISEERKEKALEDYISSVFHKMGVDGY